MTITKHTIEQEHLQLKILFAFNQTTLLGQYLINFILHNKTLDTRCDLLHFPSCLDFFAVISITRS